MTNSVTVTWSFQNTVTKVIFFDKFSYRECILLRAVYIYSLETGIGENEESFRDPEMGLLGLGRFWDQMRKAKLVLVRRPGPVMWPRLLGRIIDGSVWADHGPVAEYTGCTGFI
jgi:hypothetical protein